MADFEVVKIPDGGRSYKYKDVSEALLSSVGLAVRVPRERFRLGTSPANCLKFDGHKLHVRKDGDTHWIIWLTPKGGE